jgi:hypothetical protein
MTANYFLCVINTPDSVITPPKMNANDGRKPKINTVKIVVITGCKLLKTDT